MEGETWVELMLTMHTDHLTEARVQGELTLAGLGDTVMRSPHSRQALKDSKVDKGLPGTEA